MIDKLEAARRQIECAIRLVVDVGDELAVHTLTMAALGILADLAKGREYYEYGVKPEINKLGRARFLSISNYLKHADRDPQDQIEYFNHEENDW